MKANIKYSIFTMLLLSVVSIFISSCNKDEIVYEETRLFRPVLNDELKAELNTIIINLAKIKEATSYTVEISEDSFATAPLYTFTTEKNLIVVNAELTGAELAYNTLYQVRVYANAAEAQYNSKPAFLGSVRTEKLPSIMLDARAFDVTDVLARIRWNPSGDPVDGVKTFAKSDKNLKTPLNSYTVSSSPNAAGEIIIDNLQPNSEYQVAIYSGTRLRGLADYKTLIKGVYPGDANVVDLTNSEDPDALTDAFSSAADGGVILLKKGIRYNFPSVQLSKSITIKGAYDLIESQAELFTTADWIVTTGVSLQQVVFDDIKIIGEDPAGDYVFNINNSGTPTVINDLVFKNCTVTSLRGIARLRGDSFIRNFTIENCIVYNIGGYGIFTCDTDGAGKAAIDNVFLLSSSFYQITAAFTSRQNSQRFVIDACNFNQFTEGGQKFLRYRGGADNNNILQGLTISNSIFGTGWDKAGTGANSILFVGEGLTGTSFSVSNTWATSDFVPTAGSEMAGFPPLNYSGNSTKLWTDPANGNFKFLDSGFTGKYDSGDPRWRVKL